MDPTIVPQGVVPSIADYLDVIVQTVLTNPVSLVKENWVGMAVIVALALLRKPLSARFGPRKGD